MQIYRNKNSAPTQKVAANSSKNSNRTSVAIIGAGWLGMSLAKYLRNHAFEITLAKTQAAAVAQLVGSGWRAARFTLGAELPALLGQSHIAFLNIPPGRKDFKPQVFTSAMCQLIDHLALLGTKRVIMISTTSVYAGLNGDVFDTAKVAPESASAKAHVAIERHLRAVFTAKATIVRAAGLVGGNRHPIYSLAGKSQLKAPGRVVNLIHRDDLIHIIAAIIQREYWGQTCHVAAPLHPSRSDYYRWCAAQLKLVAPTFTADLGKGGESGGKIINSGALFEQLEVTLRYPSPYDMLATAEKRD